MSEGCAPDFLFMQICFNLASNQFAHRQRHIPNGNDQTPYENDSAYDRANQDIQCKHGNTAAERATERYDPEKHTMDSERKSTQKPQYKIVRDSVLCTGGFENKEKYCCESNG